MAIVRTRRHPERPGAVGWSVLLSEALLFGVVSVAVFALVGRVPDGRGDLGFLCALVLVLHALAFLRWVERLQDFLALDCPRCEQNFHGYPDRYPVPFRKRCAHCGQDAHPPA
jgi:hypothetical protein